MKVSEGAEHFLFRCSIYNYYKVTLFQSTRNYNPLNINILLFGDENLIDEDNINRFTAVQTFIKDTQNLLISLLLTYGQLDDIINLYSFYY